MTGTILTSPNYSGWYIDEEKQTAELKPNRNGNTIIKLNMFYSGVGSMQHAWWPKPPPYVPDIVLSGICLWDSRWQMEFVRVRKKDSPARRRLNLKHDRNEAMNRIRAGQKVERITFPSVLGEYHRRLIEWHARYLKQWNPKKIYYHFPIDEYHFYISKLEELMGIQLTTLHEKLDSFASELKLEIQYCLGELSSRVTFMQPMRDWGVKDPVQSCVAPYFRIGELMKGASRVAALVDLQESFIAREYQSVSGSTIPVLGVVLGIPHPYRSKTLNSGEYEEMIM